MVQLPALNTPQFDWCRTRLPNRPQPVPPIFQPEVAARAIAWAATHRRRGELLVGGPTLKVVLGNKLAAGLGDRYLARTGYDSQQTDEPIAADREDNLFEPVPTEYPDPYDRRRDPRDPAAVDTPASAGERRDEDGDDAPRDPSTSDPPPPRNREQALRE